MVTKNGGIKSSAKFDEKLYSQINRVNFICCAIILVVGAAGLILMVVMHFIVPESDDIFLIVCFGILTAAGLFLTIATRINIKKAIRADKNNETEVYSDHFLVTEFERGIKVADAKVYFKSLYKCKESKDFFLAYVTRTAVHPIGKEGMTPAERAAVRQIMGLPPRTELITSTVVPADARQTEDAVEPPEVKSGDVFEDFPDTKESE